MANKKKAVLISSGGLDSTTCMGIAAAEGYDLYPLTFDYGQRHRIELEHARQVAAYYEVEHRHRLVPLAFFREWGGSALTDDTIAVPQAREAAQTGSEDDTDIPVTYVPGRNLLFLSVAASYAEIIGAEAIFIGVNALDYSGYPDCRPAFIEACEEVMKLATKVGTTGQPIQIKSPLIHLSKAQIITLGMELGVPYHLTTSCYNGQARACGSCDSCRLRLTGFADAGYRDPIEYEQE
jgi:7-cyano-7-deazaguanine synthase